MLHRILAPVDFSAHSQQAFRLAIALAEKFQSKLFLLHVIQDLSLYQPDEVTVAPVMPPVEELTAAAKTALDRLIADNNLKRFDVEVEVVEGSPVEEIVDFAGEKKVDLIVLGTHGRGWLAHVLLGSVAEKVVRKAPCPVLTVRSPEGAV